MRCIPTVFDSVGICAEMHIDRSRCSVVLEVLVLNTTRIQDNLGMYITNYISLEAYKNLSMIRNLEPLAKFYYRRACQILEA
jgi:hypothetical protein